MHSGYRCKWDSLHGISRLRKALEKMHSYSPLSTNGGPLIYLPSELNFSAGGLYEQHKMLIDDTTILPHTKYIMWQIGHEI